MTKPIYLYHASPVCGLKKIEPRQNTSPQDFTEGPVVFATDNFSFSTMFLVPHDDSWANGGAFSDIPFFVISDEARFKKADKGGSIYMVPSKSFKKYNKREWFTKRSVKTESCVHFDSGLLAMIINGVQVYFTSLVIYRKIQNAADHGVTILNGLTSENEKMGLKVEKLDLYQGSKKPLKK